MLPEIIKLKISILRYGVNFYPYDLFTNYPGIENFKTKKIKKTPKVFNKTVYDVSRDENLIPSEVILIFEGYESIVKLRYSYESPLELKVKNDEMYFLQNGSIIDIKVKFLRKLKILGEKTPVIVDNKSTFVDDFIDVVGVNRVSILLFEGCYNWICGNPCKFCDLHPKSLSDRVIKPTLNNLHKFDNNIEFWWENSKSNFLLGIKYSLDKIVNYLRKYPIYIYLMAGNLPENAWTWKIAIEILENISAILSRINSKVYINISPHSDIQDLKKIKYLGVHQVQYNLEVANKYLFENICPGKIKYDTFVLKLIEAVQVFGKGNVRTNFVFGLQNKFELLKNVEKLAKLGIVADYSVFQPKRKTPLYYKSPPDFNDVLDFSFRLASIYRKYSFEPIFCSLSSRSSIMNEVFDFGL